MSGPSATERAGEAFSLTCHNFSDIRRRPLVIGKLDQVRLPFVVTMPQLAVGALTFACLFLTRPVWGAVMSDRLHIVTFVVVPIVVAQQVSRTSIEGRTVSKAAVGFARLWFAPRHGEINGRRRRAAAASPVLVHPLVPRSGAITDDPVAAVEPRPSRPTVADRGERRRRRRRGAGSTHVSRRTRARRARQADIHRAARTMANERSRT